MAGKSIYTARAGAMWRARRAAKALSAVVFIAGGICLLSGATGLAIWLAIVFIVLRFITRGFERAWLTAYQHGQSSLLSRNYMPGGFRDSDHDAMARVYLRRNG